MIDESVLKAIEAQKEGLNESNRIGRILNALSMLKSQMPEKAWVGFYADDGVSLKLSYFQGTPACEDIPYSRGVVGAAYREKGEIIVDDVTEFPGYICCDEAAASEYCLYVDDLVFDVDYPKGFPIREDAKTLFEAGRIIASMMP
jgi:putative methionine-R-sulfoxide reductase with GAF domain